MTIEDLNTKTEFNDRKYLNNDLKEMFFNLKLIQSYGSGIRRAKNSLKQIGSPELVFEPDNDTDDYTLVTAYINGEFVEIQKEEAEMNGASVQEITQEITQEIAQEIAQEKDKKSIIQDNIVKLMMEKPEITTKEIALRLGLTSDNVKYRIRIMRESGMIEHQGSTKAGRWMIL